jgi:uncharacterized membrane protein
VPPAPQPAAENEVGESRWPMATAVVATIILTLLVPNQVRIAHIPRFWPILELLLLGVLIVGDPGRIDRRSKNLHRISMALVGLLVTGAMVQTLALTTELIDGGAAATSGARTLLEAGAAVWVVNNIAYALFYWELDGGGAAARAWNVRAHPDFAFPQHMEPSVAPPGWYPKFPDYLYLGFTNAIAFSPTDVMPLTYRAKTVMLVQSMISLVLIGLIIARAVNVLPS